MIISGNTLLQDRFVESTLHIENGIISRIQNGIDSQADHFSDGYIVPGFIDLQLNGAYGDDFTTHGVTATRVAARLPETGCTAFLPTIITSPFDSYSKRLHELSEAMKESKGATILGVHLEGPYFNPVKRGAHNPDLLREINVDEITRWADPSVVRLVTLAPELPKAIEAIKALNANGITVSAGHSNATYNEAVKGLENGIGMATHLFNAMSNFNHRDPGLPGAALSSNVPCGIIADGVHVHPMMLKLAYQIKGVEGLCLVTDAMAAMGTSKRSSNIGDRATLVDESSVRLADGTLAGSILKMDRAVRNIIKFTNCSLIEAVTMASTTPAKLLGLDHKGRLAVGCDADIVVLDKELQVSKTFVNGKLFFEE